MAGANILTNKHFVVALIVAPILAVIAYFAVDRAVTEPPKPAQSGQSYPLAAASNCRYSSGRCTMKNGNFKLQISTDMRSEKLVTLHLSSEFALDNAQIALVPDADASYPPLAMEAISEDRKQWSLTTSIPDSDDPLLRLVVSAAGSTYFGESGLAFSEYETSFDRDFRAPSAGQ